jgi:glycosyltransferase involved in cell wall biosynthesis
MNIVILCKRAPQNKDLWFRPYGRFYHLAKYLAARGDNVHLVLLSHKSRQPEFNESRDGLSWYSCNLLPNPFRYFFFVRRLARSVKADWIIGFSDTYFGVCAQVVGKTLGTKVLIDAYDNYESYMDWCAPLHWLWRWALRNCTAVTAAGPGLLDLLASAAPGGKKNGVVIEMSADPCFKPGAKLSARKTLGLPIGSPIVAYCGSLCHGRGVDELFAVIARLSTTNPEICWVLSGRLGAELKLPSNCLYLGYVKDDQVVEILRSSDVILCVNKPGQFGDYAYPVKIYESLAVGVPVVAFSTKSVDYVMRNNVAGLVPFGDIDSLAEKITNTLNNPYEVYSKPNGWCAESDLLREHLLTWC